MPISNKLVSHFFGHGITQRKANQTIPVLLIGLQKPPLPAAVNLPVNFFNNSENSLSSEVPLLIVCSCPSANIQSMDFHLNFQGIPAGTSSSDTLCNASFRVFNVPQVTLYVFSLSGSSSASSATLLSLFSFVYASYY